MQSNLLDCMWKARGREGNKEKGREGWANGEAHSADGVELLEPGEKGATLLAIFC
jgi:hypothetical protein